MLSLSDRVQSDNKLEGMPIKIFLGDQATKMAEFDELPLTRINGRPQSRVAPQLKINELGTTARHHQAAGRCWVRRRPAQQATR